MRILLLLCLGTAIAAQAQTPTVQGAVTLGGGRSTGGPYALTSSFDPIDSVPSGGGPFILGTHPFDNILVVTSPIGPTLVVRPFDGAISISWAPLEPGFVLEMTPSLVNPLWTPVTGGTVSPTVVGASADAAFFRLRRSP